MAVLWFGEIQPIECEIHPAVPMSILQHFLRKPEQENSATGVILGTQAENVMQAKVAVNIAHSENNNTILIPKGPMLDHTKLVQHAYPSYKPVGTYYVGDLSSNTIAIHIELGKYLGDSNLFLLSVAFEADNMQVQAFKIPKLGLTSVALLEPIVTKVISEPLDILRSTALPLNQALDTVRDYDGSDVDTMRKLEDALTVLENLPERRGIDLKGIQNGIEEIIKNAKMLEGALNNL